MSDISQLVRRATLAGAAIVASTAAFGSSFDIAMEPVSVSAAALEQPMPAVPDGKVRGSQEGWVRLNFVVDADGRVVDPIVVDSTGGALFERSALDAAAGWRFEPPADGAERANNTLDLRFEKPGADDKATRGFMRRYRNIANALHSDNLDRARNRVDMANESGGWNLYETTMLAILNGRLEGAEGDPHEQLEHYRRALAVSNSATLNGNARLQIIGKILELEVESRQYGAALQTLELLQAEPNSANTIATLSQSIAELDRSVSGSGPLVVEGSIYNPCDCDAGEPLWSYVPARRRFSFAELSGNVERFEARCENHRISAEVETGTRWSLPADWGSCRVFVFGEDAATFELIEHGDDTGDS